MIPILPVYPPSKLLTSATSSPTGGCYLVQKGFMCVLVYWQEFIYLFIFDPHLQKTYFFMKKKPLPCSIAIKHQNLIRELTFRGFSQRLKWSAHLFILFSCESVSPVATSPDQHLCQLCLILRCTKKMKNGGAVTNWMESKWRLPAGSQMDSRHRQGWRNSQLCNVHPSSGVN